MEQEKLYRVETTNGTKSLNLCNHGLVDIVNSPNSQHFSFDRTHCQEQIDYISSAANGETRPNHQPTLTHYNNLVKQDLVIASYEISTRNIEEIDLE